MAQVSDSHLFNIDIPSITLEQNDKVHAVFYLSASGASNGCDVNDYTASFTGNGIFEARSLISLLGYSYLNCPFFHTASIIDPNNIDEITFSAGLSGFHNNGYTFVPNPTTGSISPLYPEYGDVDYPFIINRYGIDILSIHLSDGTYVEYRVMKVYKAGNLLKVVLNKPLSNIVKNDLAKGTYFKFLILTQVVDETNAYLIYKKRPGQTSYGFLIPNDLSSDMLKNIDTITKEMKQKLLASEQGTTEG